MPMSIVSGLPGPVPGLRNSAGFTFCYRTKALGEVRIPSRDDGDVRKRTDATPAAFALLYLSGSVQVARLAWPW
jgi:hypothetical protein